MFIVEEIIHKGIDFEEKGGEEKVGSGFIAGVVAKPWPHLVSSMRMSGSVSVRTWRTLCRIVGFSIKMYFSHPTMVGGSTPV